MQNNHIGSTTFAKCAMRRTIPTRTAVSIGTLALAVIVVLAYTTVPTVAIGDFTVGDINYTTEDGTISDIELVVDSSYSWDASEPVDKYQVAVDVSKDGSTWEQITYFNQTGISQTGSDSIRVKGSILETSQYSASDFEPSSEGSTITETVNVRLRFDIYKNGTKVGSANQTTTSDISITWEDSEITTNASVSGSGNWTIS